MIFGLTRFAGTTQFSLRDVDLRRGIDLENLSTLRLNIVS